MSRHKNYEKAAKIRDLIYDLESVIGSRVRKELLKGIVYNPAVNVLRELGMDIKVVGLAKRFEEVYGPDVLRLPKDSPALKLLMRVRDEAHRFAIAYHRKLKGKL